MRSSLDVRRTRQRISRPRARSMRTTTEPMKPLPPVDQNFHGSPQTRARPAVIKVGALRAPTPTTGVSFLIRKVMGGPRNYRGAKVPKAHAHLQIEERQVIKRSVNTGRLKENCRPRQCRAVLRLADVNCLAGRSRVRPAFSPNRCRGKRPGHRPGPRTTRVTLRIASRLCLPTTLLLVEDLYVINRLRLHIDAVLGSRQGLAIFRYHFGDGADLFAFKVGGALRGVGVDSLQDEPSAP